MQSSALFAPDPGPTSDPRLEAHLRAHLGAWPPAGCNVVAIPLAGGALAWAGISLPPAVGAVLMSVSTIVVALDAQLLRGST